MHQVMNSIFRDEPSHGQDHLVPTVFLSKNLGGCPRGVEFVRVHAIGDHVDTGGIAVGGGQTSELGAGGNDCIGKRK